MTNPSQIELIRNDAGRSPRPLDAMVGLHRLPKPIYEEDGIVLYNADCTRVLPLLEPMSADFCFADPPYGIDKAEWDKEYPAFLFERELLRIARNGVAVTPGQPNFATCISRMGESYKGVHAARNLNGMTFNALGFENWIGSIIGGNAKRGTTFFDFTVSGTQPDHPSPKPIEFMMKLLDRFTEEGWTVCDPYAGSGTTLVAAKRLSRKAIGIELSAKHCRTIIDRLRQRELF